MSRFLLLIALCAPFAISATISFGDQSASIVIEDGSTLQVNGDVFLTGTVVNNGTLHVTDGVSFDISEGIYIDHGGRKRIFTEDTTLFNDIALSDLNTLTIASPTEGGTIIVTGTGQKIIFSDSGMDQLIIGANTTVVFRCIEFVGYFDGAISFDEGSSVQFAASTLTLTKDVTLTPTFYFVQHPGMPETPSYIRGNGYSLALDDGVLYIELDTALIIDTVTFASLSGNHIQGHAGSVIEFSDCILQLSGETVFIGGLMSIKGTVVITGSGPFIYGSSDIMHIQDLSSLTCKGIEFIYGSSTETPTIVGESSNATSQLILDESVFHSQVPVLNLFSLQVISKGSSVLYSLPFDEGAFYGEVNIGGEEASNNSSLRCSSGTLTLYDVMCNVVDY